MVEFRQKGFPIVFNRFHTVQDMSYVFKIAVNAAEVQAHGYPVADSRTNDLLPKELLEDPILYPAQELLTALEFGAAATLTDPNRAELLARFKSA